MIGNKFTHEFERASFRLEGGRGGIHHFSFLFLSNGGKAGIIGSFSGRHTGVVETAEEHW